MNQRELPDIINGCRNRDRSSQYKLYNLYYPYSMSIARRYLNSVEDLDEVVNDAFFKVFTKLDLYTGDLPIKSWIRKIVINTAIDYIRARKRMPVLEELEVADQSEDIESGIQWKMTREQILAAVQKLTPGYRTVFNLYVVDECTHEEISEMLGITIGASKSNLARARKILRTIFEHERLHS